MKKSTIKKSTMKKLIETVIKEIESKEQDICGICGEPGADKVAHPMLWPGEQKSETGMVHVECEKEECQRAHQSFMQRVGPNGVKDFLKNIKENSGYSHGYIAPTPPQNPINEIWKDKLQNVYDSYEEFEEYDRIYNLSKRLGYSSTKEAWNDNPTVSGSINPNDYKRIKEPKREITLEYSSPEARKKAIENRSSDALKLLWKMTRDGLIDYKEFIHLLADIDHRRKGFVVDREPQENAENDAQKSAERNAAFARAWRTADQERERAYKARQKERGYKWYSTEDLKLKDIENLPDRPTQDQLRQALWKVWEWIRSGNVSEKEFEMLFRALVKKSV